MPLEQAQNYENTNNTSLENDKNYADNLIKIVLNALENHFTDKQIKQSGQTKVDYLTNYILLNIVEGTINGNIFKDNKEIVKNIIDNKEEIKQLLINELNKVNSKEYLEEIIKNLSEPFKQRLEYYQEEIDDIKKEGFDNINQKQINNKIKEIKDKLASIPDMAKKMVIQEIETLKKEMKLLEDIETNNSM